MKNKVKLKNLMYFKSFMRLMYYRCKGCFYNKPTESPGRVAVITGANQGIGYQVAYQLGLSGRFKHIVLACIEDDDAKTAKEDIEFLLHQNPELLKVKVHAYKLFLSKKRTYREFYQHMKRKFGKIDLLVNNAGMSYKIKDETPYREQCQQLWQVNFRGTVEFTEYVLPLLRESAVIGLHNPEDDEDGIFDDNDSINGNEYDGDTRIVFVSSILGKVNQVSKGLQKELLKEDLKVKGVRKIMKRYRNDIMSGRYKRQNPKKWSDNNYGMSYLGVNIAMKAFARTEIDNKIIVNAICPGYCRTEMTGFDPNPKARSPIDAAKDIVHLCLVDNPPYGEFYDSTNQKYTPFVFEMGIKKTLQSDLPEGGDEENGDNNNQTNEEQNNDDGTGTNQTQDGQDNDDDEAQKLLDIQQRRRE